MNESNYYEYFRLLFNWGCFNTEVLVYSNENENFYQISKDNNDILHYKETCNGKFEYIYSHKLPSNQRKFFFPPNSFFKLLFESQVLFIFNGDILILSFNIEECPTINQAIVSWNQENNIFAYKSGIKASKSVPILSDPENFRDYSYNYECEIGNENFGIVETSITIVNIDSQIIERNAIKGYFIFHFQIVGENIYFVAQPSKNYDKYGKGVNMNRESKIYKYCMNSKNITILINSSKIQYFFLYNPQNLNEIAYLCTDKKMLNNDFNVSMRFYNTKTKDDNEFIPIYQTIDKINKFSGCYAREGLNSSYYWVDNYIYFLSFYKGFQFFYRLNVINKEIEKISNNKEGESLTFISYNSVKREFYYNLRRINNFPCVVIYRICNNFEVKEFYVNTCIEIMKNTFINPVLSSIKREIIDINECSTGLLYRLPESETSKLDNLFQEHKIDISNLKSKEQKKKPIILMIHGGPNSVFQIYPHTLGFLILGFPIMIIHYPASLGFGQEIIDFSRGKVDYQIETFSSIMNIATEIVGFNKFIVLGHSYGGHLALILNSCEKFKDEIICTVSLSPVTDLACLYFTEESKEYVTSWVLSKDTQCPLSALEYKKLFKNSSVSRKLQSPAIIFMGDLDQVSPLQYSTQYYRKMKSLGSDIEMIVYPLSGHYIWETKEYFYDALAKISKKIEDLI